MKLFILFFLILAGFLFLMGPTMITQKKCYDYSQTRISEINSNLMMRGWSPKQVCENRFAVLSDLESCVNNSSGTGKIAVYKQMVVNYIIPYIRPLTATVKTQQEQHDNECIEFKTLLFTASP